jgi:hypothetical protein
MRPTAYFNCPKTIPILDGASAALPLSLSGRLVYISHLIVLLKLNPPYRQPFSIKYFKQGEPAALRELYNVGDRDKIAVTEPGTYEIAEVRDAYCTGVVSTPNECKGMSKTVMSTDILLNAPPLSEIDSSS